MKQVKGFSLIEILIAIAILSILVAIALPSYTDYVARSRRADATAAIMAAVNAMERSRANNFSYASAVAGATFPTNVPFDGSGPLSYVLTLENDATTYTITATSQEVQSNAVGAVEVMTINERGLKTWTLDGNTENCWPSRIRTC